MTSRLTYAAAPEPHLEYDASRRWPGLAASRLRATPGLHRTDGMADHRVVVYLTPEVPTDCACEGLAQRRVGQPFEFDLIPAGASGRWEDAAAMDMLSLRLAPEALARTAEGLDASPDALALAPRLGARDAIVEHVARALMAELAAPEPASRIYVDGLATALSTRLLAGYAKLSGARQTLSKLQQRRILDYVEANLTSELSLHELAAVAGISVPHLTTLFRRTMGQSVHAYVMERRVERARTLLLQPRARIAEVALEAGFSHQSHLARWMRRLLGLTPAEVLRACA